MSTYVTNTGVVQYRRIEDPQTRAAYLEGMTREDSWGVYCEEFEQAINRNLDARIFDPSTDANERELLVRARSLILTHFAPEPLVRKQVARLDGNKAK